MTAILGLLGITVTIILFFIGLTYTKVKYNEQALSKLVKKYDNTLSGQPIMEMAQSMQHWLEKPNLSKEQREDYEKWLKQYNPRKILQIRRILYIILPLAIVVIIGFALFMTVRK